MGWIAVSRGGRIVETYGDIPRNHWSVCDSPASIDSIGHGIIDEAEANEFMYLESQLHELRAVGQELQKQSDEYIAECARFKEEIGK